MLHRTPFILPLLYPSLLWRMPANEKILYLTFDDGPVPGPTEFVLEELKKWNVKASFFCIGDNICKYPDLFKRVVADGHNIGNHTFNHLKGWQTKLDKYVSNVQQCDREMRIHSPLPTVNLFRPPYGRITRAQINALMDKRIVMWDVLTRDYDSSLSSEKCLKNSLAAIRNGSIIVFHDSIKADKNLRFVLPRFLEACLQQEFSFKTLL